MIIKNIKKQVLVSKSGNPYARISLQLDEYRDGKGNLRWISGFGNKHTWAWKFGDDVQPTVTDDGKYLNFTFGEDSDADRLDVYRLPATVGFVMELLKGKTAVAPTKTQIKVETVPSDEEQTDDIPF